MIAFLSLAAKSILTGTHKHQGFFKEIDSLMEKKDLFLEHRGSFSLAKADREHFHLVRHFLHSNPADSTMALLHTLEETE